MLKQHLTLGIPCSNRYQGQVQVYNILSQFIQSETDNIPKLHDLHRFESNSEHFEFIDFLHIDNYYLFL